MSKLTNHKVDEIAVRYGKETYATCLALIASVCKNVRRKNGSQNYKIPKYLVKLVALIL